jgi:hypothetical protein
MIKAREGYEEADEDVTCSDFFLDTVTKALKDHEGRKEGTLTGYK